MSKKPIFAVITAYYKEPLEIIQRAISSVQNMYPDEFEIRHYLIADGHPQKSLVESHQFHFTLNKSHSDFGDTPRLVGSMIAIREGASGIMFLDADNILYKNHLQLCNAQYISEETNIVLTKREWLRIDGSRLNYSSIEDDNYSHVDTGCFTFFDEAIFEVLKWAFIPKELSSYGDRYFWNLLKSSRKDYGATGVPTVGYTCLWKDIYTSLGETPPDESIRKTFNHSADIEFFDTLSASERKILFNRLKIKQ